MLVGSVGMLGALAAPMLVGTAGEGGSIAFVALALAAGVGVLLWQRWDWLALGAFAVSAPQLIAWIYESGFIDFFEGTPIPPSRCCSFSRFWSGSGCSTPPRPSATSCGPGAKRSFRFPPGCCSSAAACSSFGTGCIVLDRR